MSDYAPDNPLTAGDIYGRKPATIDRLWRQFRSAIDAAYKATPDDAPAILRDYAENVGMEDKIETLLDTVMREERHHRAMGRRWVGTISERPSLKHCAKLIILHAASYGAMADAMPEASDWLVLRRTYVEATVIGWLIRSHVSHDWKMACAGLDYGKVVK